MAEKKTTKTKKDKAVSTKSEAPAEPAAVAAEPAATVPEVAAGLAEETDGPSEPVSDENEAAAVFDQIEQNAVEETPVTAPVEKPECVTVTQKAELTPISSGKRKLLARNAG